MALSTKDDILEAISNLTVIELKELLDAFEEKFDVTAAAPVAVAAAAPAGGGGDAAAEEEKDEYDVVLAAAGQQKIQVVKAVKDLLGVGLKDAKDRTRLWETVRDGLRKVAIVTGRPVTIGTLRLGVDGRVTDRTGILLPFKP